MRRPRHATSKRKREKDVPYDVRLFVYQRDNWRCVLCPTRRPMRKIGLHHLITKEEYDPRIHNFKNGLHDVRNLVTVCPRCHKRIHRYPALMERMERYQIQRFGQVRYSDKGVMPAQL